VVEERRTEKLQWAIQATPGLALALALALAQAQRLDPWTLFGKD